MDKFNEDRYSIEDALSEAEKIQQKVGKNNASAEEYNSAEQQVENEKTSPKINGQQSKETSSEQEKYLQVIPMPDLKANEFQLSPNLRLERFADDWRVIGEVGGWKIEKQIIGDKKILYGKDVTHYKLVITAPNGKEYGDFTRSGAPGTVGVPQIRRNPRTGDFEIYLRGEQSTQVTRDIASARGETWDVGNTLEKVKSPDVVIGTYPVERHDLKGEKVTRFGWGVNKGKQTGSVVAVCQSGKLFVWNEKWQAWRPWLAEVSEQNVETYMLRGNRSLALYSQGAETDSQMKYDMTGKW